MAETESEVLRIGVVPPGVATGPCAGGAGALLGLADARDASVVSCPSFSVSGGSIANAVLMAGGDYRTAESGDVDDWLAPGLRQWAHTGLFFPGSATHGWAAARLALLSMRSRS